MLLLLANYGSRLNTGERHTQGPCVILQQGILTATHWSKRGIKTVLRGVYSRMKLNLYCVPARKTLRLTEGSPPGIPSELWMYVIFGSALGICLLAQAVSSFPVTSFDGFGLKAKPNSFSYHVLMLLTIDVYEIYSVIWN